MLPARERLSRALPAATHAPNRMRRRTRRPGAGKVPRRGAAGRALVRVAAWVFAHAFTAFVALQAWYLGHVLWWSRYDPPSSRFMVAQLDALRRDDPRARLRHQWVPYGRIAPALRRAVIAAEDARFAHHDGVDWDAIEKAYLGNLQRGRVTHGGSTITMQLAKNLFLTGERSYWRKAQELLITWMLEAAMSKRRILEIYLNVAEWGVGVFGAEAAARHHFGVAAAALSPAQAARLAAMLPRPRFYDRNPGSAYLARRAALIERAIPLVSAP